VSTTDIIAAVEAQRVRVPISQIMSTNVSTISAFQSVGEATDSLQQAGVSGLLVVDESKWPIGVFGDQEALEAGSVDRDVPVEQVMNPAVLTLLDKTATHLVAKQALAMKARRVAVVNRNELVGVLTGVDFAKAISLAV
jgi:predicted transcriptional regulator